MDEQFFLFYLEGSIACIAIFVTMLINDLSNPNRQEKQVIFQRVMVVHILYFANDIFWAGMLSGQIPYVRVWAVILNFINLILLSGIAMEWFLFMAANTGMKLHHTKRGMSVIRLPFVVMIGLTLIAYFRAPLFWISESGKVNPVFYGIMVITALIYVVWASSYSLWKAAKKENAMNRKLYILIGLYPVEVVFFGILQLVVNNGPLFCFGITVMMTYFYINSLRDQISTDPLTKLNNRAQLMKYVSQEPAGFRFDKERVFVLMIDVNDFKKINDKYGHAEGDRALVLVAGALQRAGKSIGEHPFIGRYGGDEFILIVHAKDLQEMQTLRENINKELEEVRIDNNLPYNLSVGAGFAEWKNGDDFQSCLVRADRIMYREKERMKKAT